MAKWWALLCAGAVGFVGSGCGTSNAAACERVEELCASGSSAMVTVTAKCDPDGFDDMSNADEVKDCVDDAVDCVTVAVCLAKAKK